MKLKYLSTSLLLGLVLALLLLVPLSVMAAGPTTVGKLTSLGQPSKVAQGTGGPTQYCATVGTAIPDANPTGLAHTFTVTASQTISDMDVLFDVTHTWMGDIIGTLAHNGTTVTFMDRPGFTGTGFGCSGNNINNPVDDEAALTLETNCTADPNPAYAAGTAYRPNNPLSAFDGMDVQGDWTLTVSDNAAQDTGTFNDWCLSVTPAAPTGQPSITTTLTVGTDSSTCATTSAITVTGSTDVYYCYEVTNTGNVTLTRHDLDDSQLGTILADFPFTLIPGAPAFITASVTVSATTVSTSTWTAYNPGPVDVASADGGPASVVVLPPTAVTIGELGASRAQTPLRLGLLAAGLMAVGLGGYALRRRR